MHPPHVVVIGAGIGGLTTAALLIRAGLRVTVLEAHIYPGGSAGTFFHKGFRFDAGATLAGGFSEDGPHQRIGELLGIEWPVRPVDPAWLVQVGGETISQPASPAEWWSVRQARFPEGEGFWQRMDFLADRAWAVSAGEFPWPPASPQDWRVIFRTINMRTLSAAPYGLLKISHLLPRKASSILRTFVDAQLLISAQTTADHTNALYGAAALDLPRRGVYSVRGGMGSLASALADWIIAHGGNIYYRQQVDRLAVGDGRVTSVHTKKGLEINCDAVVANLTPWGLAELVTDQVPARLAREVESRPKTWGAFVLYLGLDNSMLPDLSASHFQVVVDPEEPLGEGNSVFISLSDQDDPTRAPAGMRAATLSTHTRLGDWWQSDEDTYAWMRDLYTEKILRAAEIAIPGIRNAANLILPGTPRSFAFFTRRPYGMVGGLPQTTLIHARGPWTGLRNAWLVGDSVFPGQSTAGVTLGAMRVAAEVRRVLRPVKIFAIQKDPVPMILNRENTL